MKKLYRSESNRMLAGVCGGIGDYFDIDPTLVRVLWAFFTVFGILPGVVAYIVAWLLVPEESEVKKKKGK